MKGDRARDPHWSTGLSSQGPNEEKKERKHEQGSQYHEGTFIWQWMEIETETHIGALNLAPKVQMRSRRRENMSKEVRTARGAFTH